MNFCKEVPQAASLQGSECFVEIILEVVVWNMNRKGCKKTKVFVFIQSNSQLCSQEI